MSSSLPKVFAIVSIVTCPTTTHAQQVVGAVGAANGSPTGRVPGSAVRALKAGAAIFFKDRIRTARGGSTQLMFLDRSTLNVGENSDLIVDDFVYHPGETEKMNATLRKGILRFVGGEISHGGGATVATPVVTIGIRGGIGTIGFFNDTKTFGNRLPGLPPGFHGGTIVINGYGTMTVHNSVSEMVISRPGYAVFVGAENEIITPPIPFDAAAARELMRTLTSRPGQHGSGRRSAARSNDNARPHLSGIAVAAPRLPALNALDYTAVFSAGNALVQNKSQANQALQLSQILAGATTTAATRPSSVNNSGYAGGPFASNNGPPAAANPGRNGGGAPANNGGNGQNQSGNGGGNGRNGHDNGKGNGGHNNGVGNQKGGGD